MNISSVISTVSGAMDKVRTKLTQIPGILMLCTCSRRPGFSSIITSAKVYADMQETDNDEIVKEFVLNVVDRIKKNIQDDGVCFVAIPPYGLSLKLTGGNAGGPILLDGANTNYVFTWAIIR